MPPPLSTPHLDSQWLSPKQVAWVLGIGERTLRDWNKRRVIPFYKLAGDIVRYDPRDVAAWLNRQRRAGRGADVESSRSRVEGGSEDGFWERIERLVRAAVESRVEGGGDERRQELASA